MRVLELAPQVYVSGQIFESDLRLMAKQGVRSIMNNRPDGEARGQPLAADLERAAEELGMTFVNVPVDARSINCPHCGQGLKSNPYNIVFGLLGGQCRPGSLGVKPHP